ncbi:MAG TPA: lysophospholipid acyltransferase family protein [Acidimicrobiia bacterium]|nr:lysophospholipid acyltransferase family protein [Acidimicrobiia bacterium]
MAVSEPGAAGEPVDGATGAGAAARRAAAFTVDPRRSPAYRAARAIVLGILRLWFRPEIRGLDKVPRTGPVLIAPLHRSNIDFGFTGLLTPRKLFYMAKEELWKYGWFGRLLEWLGAFPVNRSGADRESVRRAEEVLRQGEVLVMFPEGARRFGDTVEPLQEGVAFLAARTGAPILPVGIAGSERAMPKGAKFPKPYKVTVSIGDLIDVEARDGRRVARSEVHRLSELLRERLQAAYDDAAR